MIPIHDLSDTLPQAIGAYRNRRTGNVYSIEHDPEGYDAVIRPDPEEESIIEHLGTYPIPSEARRAVQRHFRS